jgi:hypothetical protein
MTGPGGDVTRLLAQLREGNQEAADRLVPLVYNELRRMAGAYMQRERPGHTLQATAPVHEVYMRLVVREPAQNRVSPTTIKREWRSAKAWLQRELSAAKPE